jgi:Ner family transcriptional regulator
MLDKIRQICWSCVLGLSDENDGWHRADVMAAVRKRGSNLAKIARGVGLSRTTMYWAFIRPHPRANRAIADFLGVPLNELWPHWFDSDGTLISREATPRPEIKRIPQGSGPSRPRRRAA